MCNLFLVSRPSNNLHAKGYTKHLEDSTLVKFLLRDFSFEMSVFRYHEAYLNQILTFVHDIENICKYYSIITA